MITDYSPVLERRRNWNARTVIMVAFCCPLFSVIFVINSFVKEAAMQ